MKFYPALVILSSFLFTSFSSQYTRLAHLEFLSGSWKGNIGSIGIYENWKFNEDNFWQGEGFVAAGQDTIFKRNHAH
ncbi:MAG: hypothetical protein M3Q97_08195 [Bacteroidota bacterium]|nr:hypothetical protein [Bacteroidota bacterium]